MARRFGFATMALMACLLMTIPRATAQQMVSAGIPSAKIIMGAATSGIRTDRLSPRQRRTWESIERIVFAADAQGNPLHPKLQTLWRSAEAIGSTIYIDMPKATSIYKAGEFLFEKIDVEGDKHILSIRLYLKVIDKAVVSSCARRPDGFIPFEGLNQQERYAEVLGHELAHAICALKDPNYLNIMNEQDRLNGELLSSLHDRTGRLLYDAKSSSLMSRLEMLDGHIEATPQKMEMEIWQELVNRH